MEVIRDAIYYEQLARHARKIADARMRANGDRDRDLAIRLRKTAIEHERKARQLRRDGEHAEGEPSVLSRIPSRLASLGLLR